MKRKIYLINKVFISDSIIDTDADAFYTKEERDKEWNRVVHSHNNLIIDNYGIDLNYIPKGYFYNWDNESLEFFDQLDLDVHHDYFVKAETTIEVPNETY